MTPQLSTVLSGNQDMYTSGACVSGLGAFYPGARLVYVLTLGASVPMGGTLTVTTSGCGHTAANTVLYVGTGCPTWALPFGCRVGNDNAAFPECSSNPLACCECGRVAVYVLHTGWGHEGRGSRVWTCVVLQHAVAQHHNHAQPQPQLNTQPLTQPQTYSQPSKNVERTK